MAIPSVVDTNVLIVANRRSEQADFDCEEACIDALKEIEQHGFLLIDNKLLILGEYMNHASFSGQPGAGDKFFKWAWSVQADERFCRRISISPTEADRQNFVEFPDDPLLERFDRSDRKFVAVALASGNEPQILNAVDSDWAHYFDALSEKGLRVEFLCPQHVKPGRK